LLQHQSKAKLLALKDHFMLMAEFAYSRSSEEEALEVVKAYAKHRLFGIHDWCRWNYDGSPGDPDCTTDAWQRFHVNFCFLYEDHVTQFSLGEGSPSRTRRAMFAANSASCCSANSVQSDDWAQFFFE
jgi:hypothetical protein